MKISVDSRHSVYCLDFQGRVHSVLLLDIDQTSFRTDNFFCVDNEEPFIGKKVQGNTSR